MLRRPVWTNEELSKALLTAIEAFRCQRFQEPLEAYTEYFEKYQGILEDLIEATVDFSRLRQQASDLLSDGKFQEVLRFIMGPPISSDDLKVVADVKLSKKILKTDPQTVIKVMDVLFMGLDRRRFPWLSEGREANAQEREAAILATASLIATSRTMTLRRNIGKKSQEESVEVSLLGVGLKKVSARKITTMRCAPKPGEFCRESELAGRKADFVIGLYDNRIMPLECKVSNSSTNSIKRLNNDAAAKGTAWTHSFGVSNIVPAAMLSGVFKLRNLLNAQESGLALFWAHELTTFTNWILRTKSKTDS